MMSLVPEYLRKPELVFEVLSRGESPAGDVRNLRQQLRKLIAVEQTWPASLDAGAELEFCKERVEELSGELGELSDPPIGSAKTSLGTQLLHWQSRLRLLSHSPDVSATDQEWALARVEELGRALKLISASGSVKQAVQMFEKQSIGTSSSSSELGNPAPDVEISTGPGGSAVTVGQEMPTLKVPAVSFISSCETPRHKGTEESASLQTFSKLPHPLASALGGMPQVDGLDVDGLLDFLERVLRMREFPGMSDRALMGLIAPSCRKPLGDKLLECLKKNASFDDFHEEALNFFVPFRVMEQLRVRRVFRPQSHSESLSQYVGDIRTVGRVLRLSMSENQMVDIVLQGLNPEERSRLVFAPRPVSFADLERLAILSRSVQAADFQRSQEMGYLPQPVPRPAVVPPVRPSAGRERGSPTCFECGQMGHIKANCPRRNRSSKN